MPEDTIQIPDLRITKAEARQRLKSKITSILGIPLMLFGVFMIACKVYDVFTGKCPECHFSIYEIIITVVSGYGLFAAKDSLITGMFGLLLPKRK